MTDREARRSTPPQVNPIVKAAADQVKAQKLRSNASTKAKERLHRWGDCENQMSLFGAEEENR